MAPILDEDRQTVKGILPPRVSAVALLARLRQKGIYVSPGDPARQCERWVHYHNAPRNPVLFEEICSFLRITPEAFLRRVAQKRRRRRAQ